MPLPPDQTVASILRDPDRLAVRVKTAAVITGMSVPTLNRRLDARQIQSKKMAGCRLVRVSSLRDYLKFPHPPPNPNPPLLLSVKDAARRLGVSGNSIRRVLDHPDNPSPVWLPCVLRGGLLRIIPADLTAFFETIRD